MTTPIFTAIDLVSLVSTIKDRDSLQLIGRLTAAQRTGLEAQVAQLKQMEEAIGARVKEMK